jgi:RNA polymerase sigma-70 factor (ECF subfamily)
MGRESSGHKTETLDQALPDLLESLKPKIDRILWHHQIPPQDSEDLVQEILVSFVRRYDHIENPEAWLVTALKNQCRLYWRKRRRLIYQTVDDVLLDVLADPVDGSAERDAWAHDLDRLIAKIPERCRQILRLRYGLELSPKELASELGYCYSSVSNIVRRCLSVLTDRLVDAGFCERESDA